MTIYAQLENNIVVGICELSTNVNTPNLIQLNQFDESLLGKTYTNGEFTVPITVPKSLDELKAQKIESIRDHFNAIVEQIKADAAPYEVATWETQRQEYAAWTENQSAPTPYCTALAAVRGITLQDLMAKIAPKIAGLASIQGTQHRLETLVAATTSVQELDGIHFP